MLDFAIAAYKYFPIPNENEDLDIDRRLISNFITIYQKDNDIARKAVNGPTLRRIQERFMAIWKACHRKNFGCTYGCNNFYGTKYACNHDYNGDLICLQSR